MRAVLRTPAPSRKDLESQGLPKSRARLSRPLGGVRRCKTVACQHREWNRQTSNVCHSFYLASGGRDRPGDACWRCDP